MMEVAKKLFGGAVGALSVARDVAAHAAWYVSYRVDGTTRGEHSTTRGEDRPQGERTDRG